jgi:D-glycero-alpha-D-manno-heptose-7-phosphate kinase
MILTRSPLRISIAGGGTDLPGYYEKFGSYFISAAINKFVYVAVHTPFEPRYILKYSKNETCEKLSEINHPIIREVLRSFPSTFPFVEMASMADIPSGTGLGSSGSFGSALILAIAELRNLKITKDEIASMACDIEINKLGESVGKQDQYAATFGGLTEYQISKNGEVVVEPLGLDESFLELFQSSLLLFYTGKSRSASKILMREDLKLREDDREIQNNLHEVQEMAYKIKESLHQKNLEDFGRLMHDHWLKKMARNPLVTYPGINNAYEKALAAGAFGGKIVGAGGGGFLLIVSDHPERVRQAMKESGFEEVEFRFDYAGTTRIL